jgi:tetratricopeptide (TPR) repeat protein
VVLYQRTPAGQQDELHRRIAEREEAAWGAGAAELAAELAYHYERCCNQAKAFTYLDLAGARAIAQGAYREAEQHYRKALASLETLPVSAERNDIELQIQLALAGCLNSRSFGDQGRARPLTRARALSEQSGDHAQLLRVLWQLCQYNIERMEIRSALEVAEETFHLAKDSSRPDLIAGAIYNMGEVSFWRGDVKTALEYFERATELIEKHSSIDYSAAYGIALQTELVPSIAAVVAGNPERGVTLIRRLIERSRATKDQFFYSYSLGVSSLISWILRDFAAMRAPIDTATAQAVEYGFSEVEGLGHGMAAALKAAEGDSATALIDWKVAQSVLESVGSFVWARGFAMTAEIYRQTTSEAETLHFIDSCLEQLSQSSAHLPEAELCRIKGETLGAASPSNLAQSEHWLRRAVETSQRQGARWYELRATMSLARLLDHQGRCDEARSMLAEIYNSFTEGFDTADLKDAKALLEELTG